MDRRALPAQLLSRRRPSGPTLGGRSPGEGSGGDQGFIVFLNLPACVLVTFFLHLTLQTQKKSFTLGPGGLDDVGGGGGPAYPVPSPEAPPPHLDPERIRRAS